MNPLSFSLHKRKGYVRRKHKNYNAMHNFSLIVLNYILILQALGKKQLDLVTEFSKETGKSFGYDKCAYQQTQNGKLLQCQNNLEINNLSIKPNKKDIEFKTVICSTCFCYISQLTKVCQARISYDWELSP